MHATCVTHSLSLSFPDTRSPTTVSRLVWRLLIAVVGFRLHPSIVTISTGTATIAGCVNCCDSRRAMRFTFFRAVVTDEMDLTRVVLFLDANIIKRLNSRISLLSAV